MEKQVEIVKQRIKELRLIGGDDFVRITSKKGVIEGLYCGFSSNETEVTAPLNEVSWNQPPCVDVREKCAGLTSHIDCDSIVSIEKIGKKWLT